MAFYVDTSAFLKLVARELDPAILRNLDAAHLASALSLGDELEGIVTYDVRMGEAASHHGVLVLTPRGGLR